MRFNSDNAVGGNRLRLQNKLNGCAQRGKHTKDVTFFT